MIRPVVYNNYNFPIPSGKIFEKILNLNEELTGQSIKVPSVFSKEDKTPSMVIFYSTKGKDDYYRFKDFSSEQYGDAIDLFIHFYKDRYALKNRQDAYYKILEIFKQESDFESIILNKGETSITPQIKEITDFKIRSWKLYDADFFRSFGITSQFTKEYCIRPLENYTLTITQGNSKKEMLFEPMQCYGYFTKSGELYKIYNPGNKKGKYLKVKTHIQGYEQLKPNKKVCLIMAGLKDMGAFHGLNFKDFNIIAPESENIELPIDILNYLLETHEYVFTMFDNDEAGMKRMLGYKTNHNIPFVYFNVEKDIAQCRFDHGESNTRLFFSKAFKKALTRYKTEILNTK